VCAAARPAALTLLTLTLTRARFQANRTLGERDAQLLTLARGEIACYTGNGDFQLAEAVVEGAARITAAAAAYGAVTSDDTALRRKLGCDFQALKSKAATEGLLFPIRAELESVLATEPDAVQAEGRGHAEPVAANDSGPRPCIGCNRRHRRQALRSVQTLRR